MRTPNKPSAPKPVKMWAVVTSSGVYRDFYKTRREADFIVDCARPIFALSGEQGYSIIRVTISPSK